MNDPHGIPCIIDVMDYATATGWRIYTSVDIARIRLEMKEKQVDPAKYRLIGCGIRYHRALYEKSMW